MAATLLEKSLSEHKSIARFHAQVVESKEVDEKMATRIGNSIQALKIYRDNSELALFHAEKSFDEVDEAYSEAIEVTLASKRLEASEEMEKNRAKRVAIDPFLLKDIEKYPFYFLCKRYTGFNLNSKWIYRVMQKR